MMILVRYLDGTYDMVLERHLGSLISENKIIGFERSNKWVTIGIDPLRKPASETYTGPERRKPAHDEAEDTY
ncbi:MAG: hypothetical protein HZC44_06075 [Geobacter sp.]|nr:hypothetical protein [Geobacter sp.]